MKLSYHIKFTELIENPDTLEPAELSKVAREIKSHIYKYLQYGGFHIDGDIELEFDLEENE